jgi:hypothetical protein
MYLKRRDFILNEILGSGIGSVLLGAGLTLIGVITGWLVTTVSSRPASRDNRSARSALEARQLAVRTVIALDEFVGACHAAVSDTPEFNPADPSEFVFHIDDPRLNLPRDVEWSVLQPDLAEQILWMPNRLRNVLDGLDSLEVIPPAFDDLFERREEDFSRLGVRALDLIETLSSEYKLQKPERPAYYDPRADFLRRITRITQARHRRQEGEAAQKGETSNITPLFPKARRDAGASILDADPKG